MPPRALAPRFPSGTPATVPTAAAAVVFTSVAPELRRMCCVTRGVDDRSRTCVTLWIAHHLLGFVSSVVCTLRRVTTRPHGCIVRRRARAAPSGHARLLHRCPRLVGMLRATCVAHGSSLAATRHVPCNGIAHRDSLAGTRPALYDCVAEERFGPDQAAFSLVVMCCWLHRNACRSMRPRLHGLFAATALFKQFGRDCAARADGSVCGSTACGLRAAASATNGMPCPTLLCMGSRPAL